jgi:hypothetical protein
MFRPPDLRLRNGTLSVWASDDVVYINEGLFLLRQVQLVHLFH